MKRMRFWWLRLSVLLLVFGGTLHGAVLAQAVPPAVSGRIVDAVTGAPLPGDTAPFARAELLRCDDVGCAESINVAATDSAGAFLFTTDFSGAPLPVGTYQVVASADMYAPQATLPFSVTADAEQHVGDIALAPASNAGAITGRVVDAATGAPLPGDTFPYAYVELRRCAFGDCSETVAYAPADSSGQFQFSSDSYGNPLPSGTYQVIAYAGGYQSGQTEPFELAAGAGYDTGDIALSPQPLADSISGQVVDAATGLPLRGDVAPFAQVILRQCDAFGTCSDVAFQSADSTGRFRFAFDSTGFSLPVGTYQLVVSANDYQTLTTDPFFVGEGEAYDAGTLALKGFPVRISELRPCGHLPPEGGTCVYSYRITNRTDQPIAGATWSLVSSQGISSTLNYTVFQAGEPQSVVLAPGASQVFWFQFRVPGSVADNTYICAQGFFGEGQSDPFFNTVAERDLFCIQKGYTGSFYPVPAKQTRQVFQQLRHQPAAPIGSVAHAAARPRTR